MREVRTAWLVRIVALLCALAASRIVAPAVATSEAEALYRGDPEPIHGLAETLVAFEAADDQARTRAAPGDRFAGEWALVTHQMIAIGLAELSLSHPAWADRYAKVATAAAEKSMLAEQRDFGTRAWGGEDAMKSLAGSHGHAYLAYPALAVGMARLVDPAFPKRLADVQDAVVAAFERRLLASNTGLIETYPGEAYPTDVAAVAAAIAIHGRATKVDHGVVLTKWKALVQKEQIDPASGFVIQRMDAASGAAHDAPRGSGTGLAAYYAGFVDRKLARSLAGALFRHESTFFGFGAIDEYAEGSSGNGDIDSGPVILGVSVAATGFALAPARALGFHDDFVRLYRSAALFGVPTAYGGKFGYRVGGPIGNALLLAFLASGPEIAP